MNTDEFESWLSARPEIEHIFGCVCDLNGVLRGKRMPVDQIDKIASGGVRMPLSITSVDIWGADTLDSGLVFQTGDVDGICEPTERGIIPLSWGVQPSAMVPLWIMEESGKPYFADPRRALKSVLDRLAAHGLKPVVAMEMEFYLLDQHDGRPLSPTSPATGRRLSGDGILSMDELEDFSGFFNDVYKVCGEQGIAIDSAIAENGPGQFEINMVHMDDALRAADNAMLFKRLVRALARKHGFVGTFMAKPFGDCAGNGMHVHLSMLDKDGNNVFDNGTDEGAPILRHAVGGMTASMQDLALTFAPHQNSFRRLLPGAHAPTGIAWGYENRTTAIRIPGGPSAARRIEHRVAGADCNPYLMLTSILGGALLGIEREMTPPDPVTGDAYSLDLEQLPASWVLARGAFEESDYVSEIYSSGFRDLYATIKAQEWQRFAVEVTDFEYSTYMEMV